MKRLLLTTSATAVLLGLMGVGAVHAQLPQVVVPKAAAPAPAPVTSTPVTSVPATPTASPAAAPAATAPAPVPAASTAPDSTVPAAPAAPSCGLKNPPPVGPLGVPAGWAYQKVGCDWQLLPVGTVVAPPPNVSASPTITTTAPDAAQSVTSAPASASPAAAATTPIASPTPAPPAAASTASAPVSSVPVASSTPMTSPVAPGAKSVSVAGKDAIARATSMQATIYADKPSACANDRAILFLKFEKDAPLASPKDPLAGSKTVDYLQKSMAKTLSGAAKCSASAAVVYVVDDSEKLLGSLLGRAPDWAFVMTNDPIGDLNKPLPQKLLDLDDIGTDGGEVALNLITEMRSLTDFSKSQLIKYRVTDNKVVALNVADALGVFYKGQRAPVGTYSVSLSGSYEVKDNGTYLLMASVDEGASATQTCVGFVGVNGRPIVSVVTDKATLGQGTVDLAPGPHGFDLSIFCSVDATGAGAKPALRVKIKGPKDTFPRELRYTDLSLITAK